MISYYFDIINDIIRDLYVVNVLLNLIKSIIKNLKFFFKKKHFRKIKINTWHYLVGY
jgi:hypothetical protein